MLPDAMGPERHAEDIIRQELRKIIDQPAIIAEHTKALSDLARELKRQRELRSLRRLENLIIKHPSGQDPVEQTEKNSANSANTSRLFPGGLPNNQDILDLVCKLDAERSSGKSEAQITREFTHGNENKAKSLLSQVRRLKREGKVTL